MNGRNNLSVVVDVDGSPQLWALKSFEDAEGLVMIHSGHLARLSRLRQELKEHGLYVDVLSGTRSTMEMWRYWRPSGQFREGGPRVFTPHHRDFGGVATDVRIYRADETAAPAGLIHAEAEALGLYFRDQGDHFHLDSRDLINT